MKTNIKEKGFTLIELVMVITLLGILSATALPKFANLTTQAYQASNRGLAGSLTSAVNIAHAAWIANFSLSPIALDCSIANISLTSQGWPNNAGACGANTGSATTQCTTTTNSPACAASPSNQNCADLWNNLMNNAPPAQIAACPNSGNLSNCYFAATHPTNANACIYVLSGKTTATSNLPAVYSVTYILAAPSGSNPGGVSASP